MADYVNLKYVSGCSGTEYLFQTGEFARVKSANFHSYSWVPRTFGLKYGAKVQGFSKEPLIYDAQLWVSGTVAQRKNWLDLFHAACDADIVAGLPGRIYWEDMYVECYVISNSTYPDPEHYRTVNDVTIYVPYPSWIYEVTYLPNGMQRDGAMALLSQLDYFSGLGVFKTDDYSAPFTSLPSDFRAVLLGDSTSAFASVTITTKSITRPTQISDAVTEISFPSINLGATGCLVVDARRKTATKYTRNGYTLDLSSAENVYSLRAAESRPFKSLEFNFLNYSSMDQFEVEDCYGPTGYANHTILTIYFERSEPTWISS